MKNLLSYTADIEDKVRFETTVFKFWEWEIFTIIETGYILLHPFTWLDRSLNAARALGFILFMGAN